MRRISTSYRYMIDKIGTDLFSLGEGGWGLLIWKKVEKLRNFSLKNR